jgi:DNA-binding NtrC family response regulator
MFIGANQQLPSRTRSPIRTILVVEDEPLLRLCLTQFLLDCGHAVIEAGSVAQAKTILDEGPVDLVFSDVNMPGKETGFDLEKWVRHTYPETKCLLTSGYPHVIEKGSLREPLMPKPYTLSSVSQRIDRLLQGAA